MDAETAWLILVTVFMSGTGMYTGWKAIEAISNVIVVIFYGASTCLSYYLVIEGVFGYPEWWHWVIVPLINGFITSMLTAPVMPFSTLVKKFTQGGD